jgi:hypothetical protein
MSKVVGYYGSTYWINDQTPVESIDMHLRVLHKTFPKNPNHPDIDRLLDMRSEYLEEKKTNDD